MHIPDGYLSPQTYVPLYAVSIAFWYVAVKKLKKDISAREVPYLGISSAFCFIIMMFNIPIPGGTTGHAVGAGLIAIILGPWSAVITVSMVLIVQALMFGDGGITAIGANCFNIAIAMPFVSIAVFRLVRGKSMAPRRLFVAAFAAGYFGILVAAILTALEFGLQPIIATDAAGKPLYAPYPLSIALPVMAIEHLFFGIFEGLLTALLVRYFYRSEPALVHALKGCEHE